MLASAGAEATGCSACRAFFRSCCNTNRNARARIWCSEGTVLGGRLSRAPVTSCKSSDQLPRVNFVTRRFSVCNN